MGDHTKFEFVMEKHQVENLLAKYLNDPTNYDWNELIPKLQTLQVRFKIDLFLFCSCYNLKNNLISYSIVKTMQYGTELLYMELNVP